MPAPYNYCNKPACRIQGESDMGYFVGSSGDASKVTLGRTAVIRARNCGFTDDEIVYYCEIQGKKFGEAARGELGCSSASPSSCSPSTAMSLATSSISANPTYIVNDGVDFSTLSWSITGHYNSITVAGTAYNSCSGSGAKVSPSSTTTYSVIVTNNGGTSSSSVTLKVYPLPKLTLSLDDSFIINGESTILRWNNNESVSTTEIDNGIGITTNNGNITVNPTVTTTYSGQTVFNIDTRTYTDTDSITLTVFQKPTLEITANSNILYGEDIALEYEFEYADISVKIVPQYKYRNANNDGFVTINGSPIEINPISTSAEFGVEGTLVSGSIMFTPEYNDDGPFEVNSVVTATGNGGEETKQIITNIEIDLTPDNITIPETYGELEEEPIYSPDPDKFPDVILEVTDVDIPVEVKSDKPIKISLDDGNTWLNIREKT